VENKELFKMIDKMSYYEMLYKWRYESTGSPWARGEVGLYFKKNMDKKKQELSEGEHVRISKEIGWGNKTKQY